MIPRHLVNSEDGPGGEKAFQWCSAGCSGVAWFSPKMHVAIIHVCFSHHTGCCAAFILLPNHTCVDLEPWLLLKEANNELRGAKIHPLLEDTHVPGKRVSGSVTADGRYVYGSHGHKMMHV